MNDDNELAKLLKDIGQDFVTRARDIPIPDYYTSGILRVDKLLGGGWPSGRTITLFGKEGAGKSTLSLSTVADAQRQGKNCLWIDCENSFSASWASIMGVDTESLIVIQNRSLEHILRVMQSVAEGGKQFDVIVIDSISAIQTTKYFDDDSHQIGSQAKATKEFLAKARYWYPHSLMICLSQLTDAPVGGQVWAPIPTGGHALRHESSYIVKLTFAKVDMKRERKKVGDRVLDTDTVTSVDVTWTMEKARSGDLGARGSYRLRPGIGIDKIYELLVEAIHTGVILKGSKGHYSYLPPAGSSQQYMQFKIHGEDNILHELTVNTDLREEVYKDVLATEEQFEQLEPDGADSSSEDN